MYLLTNAYLGLGGNRFCEVVQMFLSTAIFSSSPDVSEPIIQVRCAYSNRRHTGSNVMAKQWQPISHQWLLWVHFMQNLLLLRSTLTTGTNAATDVFIQVVFWILTKTRQITFKYAQMFRYQHSWNIPTQTLGRSLVNILYICMCFKANWKVSLETCKVEV